LGWLVLNPGHEINVSSSDRFLSAVELLHTEYIRSEIQGTNRFAAVQQTD